MPAGLFSFAAADSAAYAEQGHDCTDCRDCPDCTDCTDCTDYTALRICGYTEYGFHETLGADTGGGPGRCQRRSADGGVHERGSAGADEGHGLRDVLQPLAQHA